MTLDLRTGVARPHRREDYHTKISAVAADERVPIPLWTKFLDTVTAGDKDLQAYLARVAGYCMTGETTEHVLFFLYGGGANGKGVFLNTLCKIWGTYAVVASMETFIETKFPQHSTDLAMLEGARPRYRAGSREKPRLGRSQDQSPDRRGSDHRALHAARLLHLYPEI